MTAVRLRLEILALVLIPVTASAGWVRGPICSSCLTHTLVNHMYDDGLHGDGAAGDDVYGAYIAADVPAGVLEWSIEGQDPYSTQNYGLPGCPCTPGLVGHPTIVVSVTGEVVHYVLDRRSNGWVPWPGIASDHSIPAAPLEVCVGFNFYQPLIVAAAIHVGSIWEAEVALPSAQPYFYWFRTVGNDVQFTCGYNDATCSCPYGEEVDALAEVSPTLPNEHFRFEFDESVGRMRAFDTTAARGTSWGRIKTIYR